MHEASKEMEETEGFGSALYQNLPEVLDWAATPENHTNEESLYQFNKIDELLILINWGVIVVGKKEFVCFIKKLSNPCVYWFVRHVCCCFNLSTVRQWGGEQRATRFSSLSLAPGRLNEIKKDWIEKIGLNKVWIK